MDPLITGLARWEKLGTVEFPDRKLVCIDPCHQSDDGFTVDNLQSKTWDVWVLAQDCDIWGWRTARLVLTLPGERPIYEYQEGTCLTQSIVVDSGTAGFFDQEFIENRSFGSSNFGGVDQYGAVAYSGIGDGVYELWSTSFPSIHARQFTLVFLEENSCVV